MTSTRDRRQELTFSAGTFVGMLLVAFGVATFVLGVSTGIREGPYLSTGMQWGLVAAGLIVATIGGVAYSRRSKEMDRTTRKRRGIVGSALVLAGFYTVAFALSTQTTNSAPFLTSPSQKVIVFAVSFVAVAVGLTLVREAARAIGW